MKTGKIFPDSENIYQDEARILFDYYRSAAEKIVAEEEKIESQIAELETERTQFEEKLSKAWYWLLTIIFFFMYFIKKNEYTKAIGDINSRIDDLNDSHKKIFRDYQVNRLGVAYVPVADQVGYEDKSFIVDYTGSVPESEVRLSQPRNNSLLIETIGKMEKLTSEAPVVESSDNFEKIQTDEYSVSIQEVTQNDYLGELERALRTVSYCMDDLTTTSVELPLVLSGSQRLADLKEYATPEIPESAPVVKVFDAERYTPSIDKFREINRLKNSLSNETEQFEDVLRGLMSTVAGSVEALAALKIASVDKMVVDSNRLLYTILKAPYNHYSPALEAEEIERIRTESFDYTEDLQGYEPFSLRPSSRVRFSLADGKWTAEDGSTTAVPFGVHQIYEEIVAPVVQNLLNENRIERLKIYNHIKDQKLSYLTKWHQDTEEFYRANRAESSDIINLMQESLREYVAAYNTLLALQRTEESMSTSESLDSTVVQSVDNSEQSLAAFELQSKEFEKAQTDFEEYMDRLKEDIEIKAEKFGHVEYYDARLRDGYSNKVAVATGEMADLDERRRTLAVVNPLFAKSSELLPEPSIENLTFEHLGLNLPQIALDALAALDLAADAGATSAPSQFDNTIQQDPDDNYEDRAEDDEDKERSEEGFEDETAEDHEEDSFDKEEEEEDLDEDDELSEDLDEEEEEEDLDEDEDLNEEDDEDLDEEEEEPEEDDEEDEDDDDDDDDLISSISKQI